MKTNRDRVIVPYTTSSGLQIGVAWQPKLTASQASCGERYVRRKYPVVKWGAVSFFAVLAILIISARA